MLQSCTSAALDLVTHFWSRTSAATDLTTTLRIRSSYQSLRSHSTSHADLAMTSSLAWTDVRSVML